MNPRRHSASSRAFTLIEVMIAMGLFFMAIFAILALVSTSLRNARLLQERAVDATPVIAMMWLTNDITEGQGSGDFGEMYPGCTWSSNCYERTDFPTNGLYQVDFKVSGPLVGGQKVSGSHMSVLRWNPNPPALGSSRGKP